VPQSQFCNAANLRAFVNAPCIFTPRSLVHSAEDMGRYPDDPAVRRSDYWPGLTQKSRFRDDKSLESEYPRAIHELLGIKGDRREFFERLISPAAATAASSVYSSVKSTTTVRRY
jgi:hypothetical protein